MEKISPIILDSESLSFYQREGFLVVENLLSKDEVDALLAHQASRASKHDLGLRSHTTLLHERAPSPLKLNSHRLLS